MLQPRIILTMFQTEPGRFRPALDFSRLRSRRRKLEVTQTELAQAVGCHRVTIHRIERNQMNPTIELLVSIARALGTPMYDLFDVVDR